MRSNGSILLETLQQGPAKDHQNTIVPASECHSVLSRFCVLAIWTAVAVANRPESQFKIDASTWPGNVGMTAKAMFAFRAGNSGKKRGS